MWPVPKRLSFEHRRIYNFALTRSEIFSDAEAFTSNLDRAREFPPGSFFARFRAAISINDPEKKEGSLQRASLANPEGEQRACSGQSYTATRRKQLMKRWNVTS